MSWAPEVEEELSMSAHEWIKNARRAIAHWFYEPFATTAWQPTPPLALPAPKEEPIQITGEIRLPNILEGIAGERVLHYPTGTWMQMNGQHKEPHRRRDTGRIGRQTTGPMSPIPRDTDGIRQLPPREDRRLADVPTDKKLPLEDLVGVLPDNALPVQKFDDDHRVRHLEPTDDLLSALRKRDRYQLEKPPIYELPTVVTHESKVRSVLAGLPLPPGWDNANVAEVEVWAEPDQELEPTQTLTQEQKQAKEATLARIEPGLWQLQLITKYKKECEEK